MLTMFERKQRLKQLDEEELNLRQERSLSEVRKQKAALAKRHKYSARDEARLKVAATLQASRDEAAEYAKTGVYPSRARRREFREGTR
jgi:hypothetical protein